MAAKFSRARRRAVDTTTCRSLSQRNYGVSADPTEAQLRDERYRKTDLYQLRKQKWVAQVGLGLGPKPTKNFDDPCFHHLGDV